MAMLYISEHADLATGIGGLRGLAEMPPIAEPNIAIGATYTQSAALSANTHVVGLNPDAICHIAFGDNPTATTSNKRLPKDHVEYFRVQPGSKIAVIEGV